MTRIAMFGAATAALFAAGAASAQEARIEDAAARVIVIVEDRSDIEVEITPGASGVLPLTLERRGADVVIRGDLGRRDIRNCSSARTGATQPGDGATVELRGRGRIALNDAPLVVLRTPREVKVEADGAVYGAVGRGATSVDLASAGCGDWTVADVQGELKAAMAGSGGLAAGRAAAVELSLAGSGDVSVGASREAEVSVAGSGDVRLASVTGELDVSVAGSGDVSVASVHGRVNASMAGSGSLVVRGGRSGDLNANIAGSGDVRHEGEVGAVQANIVGSGDVQVARARGEVTRRVMGSGSIRVGS